MNIDKNIPIPPKGINGKAGGDYAKCADRMDIGDSVLFDSHADAMLLSSAIFAKGCRGVLRRVDGGTRVWKMTKKGKLHEQNTIRQPRYFD
jgi:hypothetical protein